MPMTPSASNVASRFLKTAKYLPVGDTIETNGMRMHRYRSALRVTDLTFAGKRGKRCPQFSLWDLDMASSDTDSASIEEVIEQIVDAHSYAQAVKIARDFDAKGGTVAPGGFRSNVKLSEDELRGVDVKPAGFHAIEIHTDEFWLEADADRFSVRDLKDRYNEPTCISRGKRGDINAFYRWVSENEPKIRQMTYNQICTAMSDQGIDFHSYCSID